MKERLIIMAGAIAAVGLVMLFFYLIRPRDRYPYERRELLTKREAAFYEILAPICYRNGWMLLMKLRLADIVKVKSGEKQYMSSPFVYRTYSSMKAAKPSSDQNCPRRLNRFWFCEHCDSIAPLPTGTPSAAFLS